MNNGYGQIFLLLLGIGLILLASSGKGRQVWSLLTGDATLEEATKETTKEPKKTVEDTIKEADEAGSGHGGVMA